MTKYLQFFFVILAGCSGGGGEAAAPPSITATDSSPIVVSTRVYGSALKDSVIILIGANPQIVEAGFPYNELGSSASDNITTDLVAIANSDAAIASRTVHTHLSLRAGLWQAWLQEQVLDLGIVEKAKGLEG